MAGTCDICGKGRLSGNKVSHANNKIEEDVKTEHPERQSRRTARLACAHECMHPLHPFRQSQKGKLSIELLQSPAYSRPGFTSLLLPVSSNPRMIDHLISNDPRYSVTLATQSVTIIDNNASIRNSQLNLFISL